MAALHERTDPVQLECVEACPVLDEAIGREVRRVVVTEQPEGSDHRSENTNAGQNLSCPINLTLPEHRHLNHDEERNPLHRPEQP